MRKKKLKLYGIIIRTTSFSIDKISLTSHCSIDIYKGNVFYDQHSSVTTVLTFTPKMSMLDFISSSNYEAFLKKIVYLFLYYLHQINCLNL